MKRLQTLTLKLLFLPCMEAYFERIKSHAVFFQTTTTKHSTSYSYEMFVGGDTIYCYNTLDIYQHIFLSCLSK